MKKPIFTLLALFFLLFDLSSQVTDVKYLIEYNPSTDMYDCKIVIMEGQATTYPQRIQFNTQYTIVTPASANIAIDSLYWPKEENANYTGTIPCLWEFGPAEHSPPVAPHLSFYSVFPNLSPPSAYNDLITGDTIRLFSVQAYNLDPCQNAIRPFENGVDPSSIEMPSGGDFSNGFTMGGGSQIYSGNLSTEYEDYISENDHVATCAEYCVTLKPTILCTQGIDRYEWSTGDTTESIEVCPTTTTDYSLKLFDINGVELNELNTTVAVEDYVITPPNHIVCAGSSFSLTACPGEGVWTQAPTNPFGAFVDATFDGVANVSMDDLISGTFQFQYSLPGVVDTTISIMVHPSPTVNLEFTELCVGQYMDLDSNIPHGEWQSNNPLIASVRSNGRDVKALAAGEVTFTYTAPSGCQATTEPLIINQDIEVEFVGPTTLCFEDETQVSANTEGYWISQDSDVANVTHAGDVTSVGNGMADLIFYEENTGCKSDPLTVNVDYPETMLTGPNSICVGETTNFEPNTGGSWSSSDNSVGTVDNFGNITGVGEGIVHFYFTSATTLCESPPSEPIYVNTVGPISIEDDEICIGESTVISSETEGVWTSSDPSIAVVVGNIGVITAFSSGTVGFHFTSYDGCTEDTAPDFLTVTTSYAYNEGSNVLCIGQSTSLYPSTGIWVSSDPSVVSVQGNSITALAEGNATLSYTDESISCEYNTIEVSVIGDDFVPEVFGNGPICEGEDLELWTDVEDDGIFFWTGPNGFTSEDAKPKIIGASIEHSGMYCVIISSDNCMSEEACVEMEVRSNPVLSFASNNGPICEGETAEFYTEAVPGGAFSWTGPNGFTSSDQNPSILNAHPGDSGSYCVEVWKDGCYSESRCTDLFVKPIPSTPNIHVDNLVCEGSDVEFTTSAVAGAEYQWTGPNGYVSNNQNPVITDIHMAESGTYCLTIIVEGCPSAQACVDVLVNPTMQAPVISNNGPLCEDDVLELTAETIPGATYIWTGPNSFYSNVQNPIVDPNPNQVGGIYSLVVRINGCESMAAQTEVVVEEIDEQILIYNNTPVCVGETVHLSVNEVPGATYQWTAPDGMEFSGSEVSFDSDDVASGVFRVTMFVDGCGKSAETTVFYEVTPDITIEDPWLCVGETTHMNPSFGGSYQMSNDIGIISGNTFTAEENGLTNLVFISDEAGCESEPVTLTVINCTDAAASCEDISTDDIICDFFDLEYMGGTLSHEDSEGTQPTGALCNDGDEAQNIAWIGFVALEGDYEIVVNTSACISMDGSFIGAQVGVYSDCDFNEANKVFCYSSEFMEDEIRISSDLLSVGQTYYLYIDGFNRSVCSYSIDIDGFYDNTFCTDLSKITGVAYIDADESGSYEAGETLLRNAMITLSPGNLSVLTNNEGRYIINSAKGNATLTARMNEGHWVNDEIVIEDLVIFEECIEDINFGFVQNLFYQEANVSVVSTVLRCNWETTFTFTVENTGAAAIDPRVKFEFDSKTTYFSTNLPGLQVNGNVAIADLGELQPFEMEAFWIKLKMPAGSANLPILEFNTTLLNGTEMVMDQYEHREVLRCSYDPNDKREYPDREGEDNLTLMDEDIEYTIRFQNNGNDTAFQVKIIDPLDPSIDKRSIRVINSSHAVQTCIEKENLIFLFEDINLVDSTTNYDGSQGYVSFKCRTIAGVPNHTIVHNTAHIVFDSNEAIVTNTTTNTLVDKLCTSVITEVNIDLCEGETYNGYDESGTYSEIYPLTYGCDSTVVLHIDVQGITYSAQDMAVCEGMTFELNDLEYVLYESQVIQDTLYNEEGCVQKVLSYDIVVSPIEMIDIDTTICDGYDYMGFTQSGIYTIDSFNAVTGCDIITTLDLEVLSASDPSCIVSSTDVLVDEDIRLYPNPAGAYFYIEADRAIEAVSLYSLASQKVAHLEGVSQGRKVKFETGDIRPGLYILEIKMEGQKGYKKIIIE